MIGRPAQGLSWALWKGLSCIYREVSAHAFMGCREHRAGDKGAIVAEAQIEWGRLSFNIGCGGAPLVNIVKTPDVDIRRRLIEDRRETPAGEATHLHRGIMMTACFRRGKTFDLPEHLIQNAGQRCRADTMQVVRGDINTDGDRTLGRINHAGPGRAVNSGIQNGRVKTGGEYGQDIAFAGDLVCRFLGCPKRPQDHVRLGGGGDAFPLRGGEYPLLKPVVPALSDVAGIGQIHNVVADKGHYIFLPFLRDAR